ncbi:RICIN domain-containing protein [Streptomyces sp. NPDC001780]
MAREHDPSNRIPPRSGTSADAGASGKSGKPGSSPVSVRRAVTMRGAAGDPGGALAPGGALTPGGGQRGRTNASPTAATTDAHARTERNGPTSDGPKGDGPGNKGPERDDPKNKSPKGDDPENKGPENKGPENKDARKKSTERTDADGATGTARGIGAPKSSAAAPAGAKAADRAATQAAVKAAAKGNAESAASAPDSSASSASASSASSSAPTTVLATVSTAGGAAPDAAVAAAAAGSGGAGTGSRAGDEPPGSRPKKPMLAAAAIVGAILIAVPFLVAGQDEREPERTRTQNAAGTVLDAERSAVPDTYTSESPAPSPKPSKEKEEKKEKPPAPVVHKQTLAPSPSASEKPDADKPKDKPKPKVKELTAAEKLRQWANGRSGVQNTVIKNAVTGQCIDIGYYDKGKINEPVNQYPCNDTTGDNQLWNLDIVDKDGGPQNAPLFLIRNSKDGLCLDLGYYKARSAGTKVSEFHCNATGDNQLWWLDPRGDGTNWIRNAVSNDLCLRPTGGATAGNDARLEIAACGFGDRWIV